MMAGARFKELLKKYGKVALGVHFSVSAASIAGLYVAVKSNVDVQSVFDRFGISGISSSKGENDVARDNNSTDVVVLPELEVIHSGDGAVEVKKRNRTAELASTSGGALALAVLLNKALIPVRVPITLALTPPVARFLRAKQIIKSI